MSSAAPNPKAETQPPAEDKPFAFEDLLSGMGVHPGGVSGFDLPDIHANGSGDGDLSSLFHPGGDGNGGNAPFAFDLPTGDDSGFLGFDDPAGDSNIHTGWSFDGNVDLTAEASPQGQDPTETNNNTKDFTPPGEDTTPHRPTMPHGRKAETSHPAMQPPSSGAPTVSIRSVVQQQMQQGDQGRTSTVSVPDHSTRNTSNAPTPVQNKTEPKTLQPSSPNVPPGAIKKLEERHNTTPPASFGRPTQPAAVATRPLNNNKELDGLAEALHKLVVEDAEQSTHGAHGLPESYSLEAECRALLRSSKKTNEIISGSNASVSRSLMETLRQLGAHPQAGELVGRPQLPLTHLIPLLREELDNELHAVEELLLEVEADAAIMDEDE